MGGRPRRARRRSPSSVPEPDRMPPSPSGAPAHEHVSSVTPRPTIPHSVQVCHECFHANLAAWSTRCANAAGADPRSESEVRLRCSKQRLSPRTPSGGPCSSRRDRRPEPSSDTCQQEELCFSRRRNPGGRIAAASMPSRAWPKRPYSRLCCARAGHVWTARHDCRRTRRRAPVGSIQTVRPCSGTRRAILSTRTAQGDELAQPHPTRLPDGKLDAGHRPGGSRRRVVGAVTGACSRPWSMPAQMRPEAVPKAAVAITKGHRYAPRPWRVGGLDLNDAEVIYVGRLVRQCNGDELV